MAISVTGTKASRNGFEIEGAHIHPADTDEHDVLVIEPGGSRVKPHDVELDLHEFVDPTRPLTLRLYREFGGVFYLRGGAPGVDGGEQVYTPGDGGPVRYFRQGQACSGRTKITAQSTVAEVAPRTIRVAYGYDV